MGCVWSRLNQRKRAKRYEVSHRHQDQQTDPVDDQATAAAATGSAPATSNHAAAQTGPVAKPKLDPQDFMFAGLQAATRVKLPGSVQGQQFIIDDCKDCDLFVLDNCASVTIDDCTNCRLFIGPTEASVFMRDCTNCSLAAITRQLRCRDCDDCNLLLLCRTRPIIESSSGMAFGCFDAPYAGLAAQMAAAGLSPFHNFWSNVFDFTPAAATAWTAGRGASEGASAGGSAAGPAAVPAQPSAEQQNWRLLEPTVLVRQLLGNPELPAEVLQLMGGVSDASAEAEAAAAATPADHSGSSTCSGGSAAADTAGLQSEPGCVVAAAAPAAAAAATAGDEEVAVTTIPSSKTAVGQHAVSSSLLDSAPVVALSQADRSCVIHTHGKGLGAAAGGSSSNSESHGMFVLFPAGQHAAALQWVHDNTAQPQQEVSTASAGASCVHTNEASIPAAVLQQMGKAAGWTQKQMKQLGGVANATFVGLEVACSSESSRQQLRAAAEEAGALCCSSSAAARLFHDLGVDG